jgi:ribonuclease G
MAKEICISSTPHETRLAILEDDQLTEIYYERENEYTLAGSIYKGRVTRVLPGMQSAFVDVGLERDAFLYVTDFLEEAGDSADFERIGTAPVRDANRQREPRPQRPSEPRSESRSEPRSDGNQQGQQAGDQNLQNDQNAIELSISPPLPAEGRDDDANGSGTRRWRGRRGRRRSGGRSGPREAGQEAIQVVPAGEPPFEAVESIDMLPYDNTVPFMDASADPYTSAAAAEARSGDSQQRFTPSRSEKSAGASRIFLPGESLSKYGARPIEDAPVADAGHAPKAAATTPGNLSAFKPRTLVEAPVLLEGGSLLAGESISKHRRQPQVESADSSYSALAAEPTQSDPAPAEREAWTPLAAVSDTSDVASADGPPADDVSPVAQVDENRFAQERVEAIAEHLNEVHLTELHAVAESYPFQTEEAVEPETIEDASASHKVDLSGPSEFRLPWSFSDKSKAKETVTEEVANPSSPETPSATEIPANHFAEQADYQAEQLNSVEQHEEEASHPHSTGDIGSGHVGSIAGFAPGSGLLEEEIIDEDEYDFAPLHAHSDEHELDELEEETLESKMGGTELGEMVREAALDHRIHIPFGSSVVAEEEAAEDGDEDADPSAADLAEAEAYGEETSEDAPAADTTAAPARRSDESRRGRGRQQRRGRNGSGGGGRGRQNTQPSDLPVISDLLKQGQEILVQIAKEPIAKKGARITSHIALPGRFLVFMPTVNHVGVSRKITSDEERQRLKRILISEKGDAVGGFIVRTAAASASEEDLRADIRFLLSLWTGIKERSDTAKAPALIYHDLNLVERVLRDQVSDNFSSIWVDNEVEYERIVRFLQRFQPSLVRRVKLYTKETPLFEQFGIQDEITKALKSKVWLKSGGSIVINQTEALVAIDINTGKYVGKTSRLEDTILRTNLDAIPEIVRQIRLRDLGGIIVIDFIDMDERKNRHRVMLALEEALKADRAPSKVLQFNDFGLVAITRKRVKQSLERTLSVQCEICTGTGMVKSPITVCNEIYVEMRRMQKTFETPDVLLRVHPEVVKTLKGGGAKWLTEMEEMIGKNIIVKSDPALHPEQYDIH